MFWTAKCWQSRHESFFFQVAQSFYIFPRPICHFLNSGTPSHHCFLALFSRIMSNNWDKRPHLPRMYLVYESYVYIYICITIEDSTLNDMAWHYITLYYTTLHYIKLHYFALHYMPSYNITLQCNVLHSITIHYTNSIPLHYIALHCMTLHYITLRYTTSHCLPYILLH